jgi:hypothetical protein
MYMTRNIIKQKNPIQEYRVGETVLLVKNKFTGDVNIDKVVNTLRNLPLPILDVASAICIGDFFFLKKREVDALYDDRTIYITNEQENYQEFMKNLIHELAHGCEETYYGDIYGDSSIKDEFLSKREKMYQILSSYGYENFPKESYLNPEYDEQFDFFLYKTVGYDKLGSLVRGIFLSPYASTSLREYFANGFEKYFLSDNEEVKRISPALFAKLSLFNS